MDTLEIVQIYGTKVYDTTVGDTLLSIARRIYLSDDEKYQRSLKEVNGLMSAYHIEPGTKIRYLSKDLIDRNYE